MQPERLFSYIKFAQRRPGQQVPIATKLKDLGLFFAAASISGVRHEAEQRFGTLVPTPLGYTWFSILRMTQTPESTEPTTATGQPESDRSDRTSRVDQLLALVGITAGVVFVVAVIFFSGLWLGRATHSPYGGRDGSCPMMSGGVMAPGMMGPGGSMEPHQTATPTTQPTPHP